MERLMLMPLLASVATDQHLEMLALVLVPVLVPVLASTSLLVSALISVTS
jgi:hypothetical protein